MKIGLAWSGGLEIEKGGSNQRRNVPLELLSRELNGLDADFFSLQKGQQPEAEIRARHQDFWPRGNFHNFAAEIADFSETAALIVNLDLVVTVDTSVAHLAGALGKPVWLLNRFDTCWRWLLGRDDSPWYQSMKIYWQAEGQNWDPVLRRVAADLVSLAGGGGSG